MPRRVIAYEDDEALRQQMQHVFYAIREHYDLIATFPNAVGVTAEVQQLKPDVVLMDIQMLGDDDGLIALYKIKQTTPNVKVMMLTFMDVDHTIFDAICLGADGYMLKTDFLAYQAPHETMRRSLNTIFADGAYLTPTVAKQILNHFSDFSLPQKMMRVKERFQSIFRTESGKERMKDAGLTKMQIKVLKFIVDGMSTSQIAREMVLSENTINSHIRGIYTTLGLNSRSLVIKKALENRWFS